jgi:tetratricopeptide (TPR) repeat protein
VAAQGVVLVLLVFYGGRVALRNNDWADEAALFLSALDVCPGSAKVQLNNGILQRRYQHWDKALAHFQRAQQIDQT